MDAYIQFNTKEVKLEVKRLSDELIRKLAFDIQAHAQVEAPVDTGFLKNSIYTITSRGSGHEIAQAVASGYAPDRIMAPSPGLEGADAAVVAGASYAFWVEIKHRPYLYPAVETVARKAGNI